MNLKHYIKHPGTIVLRIRRIGIHFKNWRNKKVFEWAIKTPRRASFYYWYFSDRFDREHHSVLYGKYVHSFQEHLSMGNIATLRRSIHRIEKGLITVPRNAIWAVDYINTTVECLKVFLNTEKDLITQQWAYDVLSDYFCAIEGNAISDRAKKLFEELKKEHPITSNDKQKSSPYLRKDSQVSDVNYKTFMTLCAQRRAVRWYKNQEIPVQLIENSIAAALTAPSACNRQPFRFIIVKNPEKLKRTVNLPMGCDTYAHNINLMVIMIGDLSSYFDERDRHLIYIDGGLAGMNFMLALETQGLSSCPINWPDIEEREQRLSHEFNLMPNERGIMFFSIGYALDEGGIPFSAKKNVELVTTKY